MPLVILLHGLGQSGTIVEAYFQLRPLAESRGFLYVHPDGTPHPAGDRFWDATDACCGLGSTADDVAYLTSIIDQVGATRNIDPSRVYVMGQRGAAHEASTPKDRAAMSAIVTEAVRAGALRRGLRR